MNKLRTAVVVSLMLLVAGLTTQAATDFKPIKYQLDSLPNGLKIIYCIDKSAPVVSTVVHYMVGSKDENPNRTGFAHFFEHLMFEGTKDIPRATIDKYVEEAGGWLNAHTSFDETVFKFRVPSNQLPLALWIEAQRMRGLRVDTVGVETQRKVVLEEKKMRNDNTAYGSMFENMTNLLFKGCSYQWNPIGYEAHIKAATIQEFRNFYNNFYQPNNAVLAIVGDFDINLAKKYVREFFGRYSKAPSPKRAKFVLKPLTKPAEKTVYDKKAQLPGVFVGYRGPALGDKDSYAMSLLGDILASGESSRLYQELVDKKQIALYAAIQPMNLQKAGVIMLIGIPAIGHKSKEVLNGIDEEIQKILRNGVTKEELQKAKNIKEAQFVSANKTVLAKAQTLARNYVYFHDPGLINTELEKYQAVTLKDIQRVAKKYLGTDKRVVLYYLPESAKK